MTTIDTSSAVFKGTIMAYGSAHPAGEIDHPALMATMQVQQMPIMQEYGGVMSPAKLGFLLYLPIVEFTHCIWLAS